MDILYVILNISLILLLAAIGVNSMASSIDSDNSQMYKKCTEILCAVLCAIIALLFIMIIINKITVGG